MPLSSRILFRHVVAAVLALFLSATVVVTIVDNGPGPGPTHTTITVRLSPAARAAVPDRQLTVPAAAVAAAATPTAVEHAAGARDETPAGVPAAVIEAGREQQDAAARVDQLPVSAPDAAPEQFGCRSRFIAVNWSSRRGVAPRLIVVHYTVSPNVRGWADVDGVTGFFARPATAASSNYVEDGEGHCNYIVREVDKAWAQAGFNPWAISIEVVNTGREPVLAALAGTRQLQRIIHDAARRWHIPLQVGAVSGCSVTRSGLVSHQMLGPCGGGHVDVCPYDGASCAAGSGASNPAHPELRRLLAGAKALDPKPVTAVDVATCRKLNGYRRDVAHHVRVSAHRTELAVRRRKALAARRVLCTSAGARRA